jgi:predicted nucleic acid-binding protein
MEVLQGGQHDRDAVRLRALLGRSRLLEVGGLPAYEHAAQIARQCRRAGESVSNSLDCLIAAVAIRDGVDVLHQNRDFEAIARHSPLRLA